MTFADFEYRQVAGLFKWVRLPHHVNCFEVLGGTSQSMQFQWPFASFDKHVDN
jgi:hypothetical protein